MKIQNKKEIKSTNKETNIYSLASDIRHYSYIGFVITLIVILILGGVKASIDKEYESVYTFIVEQTNILNNIFMIEYMISTFISLFKDD